MNKTEQDSMIGEVGSGVERGLAISNWVAWESSVKLTPGET